ncbi:drug/metabolite transporter (DMT)-like permease [Paenibacillus forsythiae]|uniref:Drug/metabolite transporter (DMT)-like permease n=1 Tax=Paenibacillus forsythiae TaxID=365616 RepID=A0ABU3HAS7_9BACL|nr:EamA family transporter [Paenibacillus forsythiae]MDT3427927.1 drug/metabolite transporter (DMT)-like permease [Paenibacillus forsythiae]
MKSREFGSLLLLASLWGASFLFIRIASPVLGPFLLIDLRVLIAGAALVIYAAVTRHRPRLLRKWKEYLLLGALNAAIPFCLIAAAELHVDASLAAILNSTTPLFTALVARVWIRDRLTFKKQLGLLFGIVGVVILVGWNPQDMGKGILLPVSMSLTAALFIAIGGVFSSRAFKDENPLNLAIGQQLAAGVLLLPAAVLFPPGNAPGGDVILAVTGLAILSTSLAYLLYFQLIRSVGPVKTLSVTFLIPAFGIFWGWLFLKETISWGTIIGLLIILLSVAFLANFQFNLVKKTDRTNRDML